MTNTPNQYTRGEIRNVRQSGLMIRQRAPKNLETPFDLVDSFLTPTELFHIRSHFPAPKLALASYQLRIDGERLLMGQLLEQEVPCGFGGRRQPSVGGTSRISREAYVRFCGGSG